MSKEATGVDKINKVCMAVLRITDEDVAEVRNVARQQAEYSHPLKGATAGWQHELGDHNFRVLDALCNLRDVIRGGEGIQHP